MNELKNNKADKSFKSSISHYNHDTTRSQQFLA